MMSPRKSYNEPLEFDIEQVRKRNRMRDKENLAKFKQLYDGVVKDLEEYKSLYLRQRSEMENYTRYKENEVAIIRKNANSELIKDLLPVLDTLDAGIQHDPKLAPVKNQFTNVLLNYGLAPIDCKGKKYDSNLEEAVGISEYGEDGTVLEEVQKGYTLNGNVIRIAKVIVSKR
ncbi:MAG: nucleotide exchange factor GrpE [Ferroplasma sp.]